MKHEVVGKDTPVFYSLLAGKKALFKTGSGQRYKPEANAADQELAMNLIRCEKHDMSHLPDGCPECDRESKSPESACSESQIKDLKLIIAGGRDRELNAFDFRAIWMIWYAFGISEVITGGATGADECGKEWAIREQISNREFKADWKSHGRSAGPIRNRQMAEYADSVLLFPGGRGTESMFKIAMELDLLIFDFRGKRI